MFPHSLQRTSTLEAQGISQVGYEGAYSKSRPTQVGDSGFRVEAFRVTEAAERRSVNCGGITTTTTWLA